jgi:hypothetical protein
MRLRPLQKHLVSDLIAHQAQYPRHSQTFRSEKQNILQDLVQVAGTATEPEEQRAVVVVLLSTIAWLEPRRV